MVIANMNLEIAMLISVLFALVWPSAGLDPLYLGTGLQSQVINLDAGARTPAKATILQQPVSSRQRCLRPRP